MAATDATALLGLASQLFGTRSVGGSAPVATNGGPAGDDTAPPTTTSSQLPDRARFALAGILASTIGEWLQESCPNTAELEGKLAAQVTTTGGTV